MNKLIPVIWESLGWGLPIVEREEGQPFVTLTSDFNTKIWNDPKSLRVFLDFIIEDVKIPKELFNTKEAVNYSNTEIRNIILKHMNKLYKSLPENFDGMFYGLERSPYIVATKDGATMTTEFCLGYTKRWPEIQTNNDSILFMLPKVFNPNQIY